MEVWYANIFGKSVRVKRLPYLNKFLNNKKANKRIISKHGATTVDRTTVDPRTLDRNDT